MLVGATVLLGLGQGLGFNLFIAIPAGVLAYAVTLVTLGLVLKVDRHAK